MLLGDHGRNDLSLTLSLLGDHGRNDPSLTLSLSHRFLGRLRLRGYEFKVLVDFGQNTFKLFQLLVGQIGPNGVTDVLKVRADL